VVAVSGTGTNGGLETQTNVLWGGSRDDILIADVLQGGGHGVLSATSTLRGGAGDDRIEARIAAGSDDFAIFPIAGINVLEGGGGSDHLTATAVLSGEDSVQATNALRGGAGDDVLTATASGFGFEPEVRNTLRGDAGNDRLFGTISSETGQNRLFGGAGDDRLTAVGGSGNILDGGAGDDAVRGTSGVDTFVFDLVAGSGDVDRAVRFDGGVDRLQFLGVRDRGRPGLVDDLDAVLRAIADQPGGDVVLGFDARRIVFRDIGTGTIDSVADLVDDPATQLVPGNADLIA
jgi:hypothetical protein